MQPWLISYRLNISHPSIRIFISNFHHRFLFGKKTPLRKKPWKRSDKMSWTSWPDVWIEKTFLKTTKCRCEKCGEAQRSSEANRWVWVSLEGRGYELDISNISSPTIIGSFFWSDLRVKLRQWGNIHWGVPCRGGIGTFPTNIRRAAQHILVILSLSESWIFEGDVFWWTWWLPQTRWFLFGALGNSPEKRRLMQSWFYFVIFW